VVKLMGIMTLRCAIYARFSSDKQSPSSIDDQNRKCREFAEQRDWTVLDEHIYADKAISGATSERDGLKRLMAAAQTKAFDVVLIDDSSRLSRRIIDTLKLTEQLKFNGVRLILISQGIDSESEQSEVLLATHGIVDSLYIKELAKKTHRGLEGKALSKLHTGGKCFGYRSVPIEDPTRKDNYGRPLVSGARLAVEPTEADIVRRIFEMYANGLSIKAVTKQLNAEKILSPLSRQGRERSWSPSSVRVVLRNERYRGVVTWGKTRKVRNPETGRRIQVATAEKDRTRLEIPEQRIVSDKMWFAVQSRLRFINDVYGDRGRKGGLLRARAASSRYIFSGLLKCGTCGGSFVIINGQGKNHRAPEYGCPAHHFRGTCTNSRRVCSDVLEIELIRKLQEEVISPPVIEYVLRKVESQMEQAFARLDADLADMQKRKEVLETEIANLTRVLASGFESPSVRAGITEREKEIAALINTVAGRQKNSVRSQIRDVRKIVAERMSDVRSILNHRQANAAATRMALAKHVKEIVLLPEGQGQEIKYAGNWHLLSTTYMGGAEGQS
jgi:site-specific DNA recombinase